MSIECTDYLLKFKIFLYSNWTLRNVNWMHRWLIKIHNMLLYSDSLFRGQLLVRATPFALWKLLPPQDLLFQEVDPFIYGFAWTAKCPSFSPITTSEFYNRPPASRSQSRKTDNQTITCSVVHSFLTFSTRHFFFAIFIFLLLLCLFG